MSGRRSSSPAPLPISSPAIHCSAMAAGTAPRSERAPALQGIIMTTNTPLVIAVGQSWNDLAIETDILAAAGVRLIDGRALPADDPLWQEAAGILLGTAHRLDRARLQTLAGARLKGVIRYGVGYDNVDAAAATAFGNTGGIVRSVFLDDAAVSDY